MKYLGLEVETLEEPLHVSSPLGTRVNVDQICQGCELEISGILLTMDLRVMDMSEFDVILGMDWLKTRQVVIDCNHRRITTYTPNDVCVMFKGYKHDALPQAVYDFRWHGQLMGWLDKTLPRPYLNSCLEDPVRHFNGLLETDSSDRRNPRSEPSLSITGLLV